MKFTKDLQPKAIAAIREAVANSLSEGKNVLWLVSGGSAVAPQVAIMDELHSRGVSLKRLRILPVDERYGPFDHTDSNSGQLGKAGFNPYPALWLDILSENTSFEDTTEYYADLVEDALRNADYVIATLGLGADGHTAGILPGSPASTDTESTVVGYTWSDYQRMTLGLATLRKLNAAHVLCYGSPKQAALQRLEANAESLTDLPAKLLYDIPDVTVYNDYVESED